MALDVSWMVCSKCGKKPPEVRDFHLGIPVVCFICEPPPKEVECPTCKGTGKVKASARDTEEGKGKTDREIMQLAFQKQYPPDEVVKEAIRLAREDERIKLKPDSIRAEERARLIGFLDELIGRLSKIG